MAYNLLAGVMIPVQAYIKWLDLEPVSKKQKKMEKREEEDGTLKIDYNVVLFLLAFRGQSNKTSLMKGHWQKLVVTAA